MPSARTVDLVEVTEEGPWPGVDPRWFRAMFDASTVPLALADEDGLLVLANAAYCAMVGRDWNAIKGRSSREFTHPDDLGQHAAMASLMARAAECGQKLRLEKRYARPDGTTRWGWVSASNVTLGERTWTMAVIHDTTERRADEDALHTAATTDPLTGLLNRRGWREQLAELQHRTSTGLVIVMLDFDRFKAYNDLHGHVAGDRLLTDFARGASAVLDPSVLLARWGGEEFALALPGHDTSAARTVLDLLAVTVPDNQSFSAGLTELQPGETLYDCFDRADSYLYHAKHLGGARYVSAD